MNNFINPETCRSCHLCVAICPAMVIEEKDGKKAGFIEKLVHTCLKCGQCIAICDTGSIQIEGYNPGNIFALKENTVDFDKLFTFLSHRRSVRNFKNKPIEKEKIDRIIELLSLTPFGVHSNSVEITVVSNREVMEKAIPLMSGFYTKLEKWMRNPVMRYFIKKEAGIEEYMTIKKFLLPYLKLGHYDISKYGDTITRNATAMIIFHGEKEMEEHTYDAHICTVYAMLAAQSLGLGTTIIGLVAPAVNKIPELRKLFSIPIGNEVVSSLILGYPKYEFKNGIRRPKSKVKIID